MTESRWAKGIISEDPLIGLPIGSELKFERIILGSTDATERAQFVNNWEFFNGAILGLALKSADSIELIGTAVMIAPGLSITATHNLANEMELIRRGEVLPYCYGIRASGLEIWEATSIGYNDEHDISYLSLKAVSPLPQDSTYYQLGVTTRAPKNGEVLRIVGFRNEQPVVQSQRIGFAANLYCASGTVSAVYPRGRDKTVIPYPAIEINCGSLGGMSGGAAIDQNGHVVGIISRGLQTDDGLGPTYVSWIVTSLGLSLDIPWPPGVYEGRVTPLSLGRKTMFIERPEAVTIVGEN